jgi:hypothetical protein
VDRIDAATSESCLFVALSNSNSIILSPARPLCHG